MQPQPPKLVVIAGDTPGKELFLNQPQTIIGRDPNQANLVIPLNTVSGRHAQIMWQAGQYWLEDLGSSNGTFVNGQRLNTRHQLQSGDKIGVGQQLIVEFRLAAETAVKPTVVFNEPQQQPGFAATKKIDPQEMMQMGMGGPVSGDIPQLQIVIAGQQPQTYPLTKPQITVGRAVDNDIVVRSEIISRQAHARLQKVGHGYQIVTSPEAANPLLLRGRPFTGFHQLQHGDKLRIGGSDPGLMVTLTYLHPSQAPVDTGPAQAIRWGNKTHITIGRDSSNDIVLDMPLVSRFHAQVERIGQRYRIQDLRSANGTFVNDQPVTGEQWLNQQDVIRIGASRLVLGQAGLAQYDESTSLRIEARGLNKWVTSDLNILQDISLVFQPREFVVVVGQSGGGKTTLVDAIAGYRPATHGQVFVNDIDVYSNFDAVRQNIGYVPQQDIIHKELTVYQALSYAAQLRMPPDTTAAEREERINEVMRDLDLSHRRDTEISSLSGGQQKRVSIGVELLTKPGLFFLDEPTSGLDPGMETAFMQLMRRLADQGRTITLVTHATKNVMLADKVVFLARGGYLAWFGPPNEALTYFDQFRTERERRGRDIEFDEIYAILDDEQRGQAHDWAERFRQHQAYNQYIAQPIQQGPITPPVIAEPTTPLEKPAKQKLTSGWRQFLILSSRNLRILTRDRYSLMLMIGVAPIVSLLDVILSLVLGRNPFDPVTGSFPEVMITLFLLSVYGVMVGGLSQMREIVKEQAVYKRERLVNLQLLPYVMSKVWVAVLLAMYHAAVYTLVHYLAFAMPGGWTEFGVIYISLTLATIAGMMLGLFASALSPNANTAPLIVVVFMLPQIVLGGALVALPEAISAPTSTKWAFQAFMAVTGPGSDVAADPCWDLSPEEQRNLSFEEKGVLCRCLGPNIVDPSSCSFPGIAQEYDPSVNEPPDLTSEVSEPVPVSDPPEEPSEPVPPPQPERPVRPADESDQVAMADYQRAIEQWQEEMDEWQVEVNRLNQEFNAQMNIYRAEMADYEADNREYIEAQMAWTVEQARLEGELQAWQARREASVIGPEQLIRQFQPEFGWTFVDKNNESEYWGTIFKTWLAQSSIIFLLFLAILVLQKRKDVI